MIMKEELTLNSSIDDVADYIHWINQNIIKPKTKWKIKSFQIERKKEDSKE